MELADTQVSKTCGRKLMRVQVPPSAHKFGAKRKIYPKLQITHANYQHPIFSEFKLKNKIQN